MKTFSVKGGFRCRSIHPTLAFDSQGCFNNKCGLSPIFLAPEESARLLPRLSRDELLAKFGKKP